MDYRKLMDGIEANSPDLRAARLRNYIAILEEDFSWQDTDELAVIVEDFEKRRNWLPQHAPQVEWDNFAEAGRFLLDREKGRTTL